MTEKCDIFELQITGESLKEFLQFIPFEMDNEGTILRLRYMIHLEVKISFKVSQLLKIFTFLSTILDRSEISKNFICCRKEHNFCYIKGFCSDRFHKKFMFSLE